MRTPLNLPCATCGAVSIVWIGIQDSDVEFTGACGHYTSASFDLGISIGDLVLRRALHEMRETRDYPLSIVFSAMAMECELSRLHHKWEHIQALDERRNVNDSELDELLRKHQSIARKIEHVARLMHPSGLDDFVTSQPQLLETISGGFPSLQVGALADGFQRALFWLRNRVLHLGDSRFKEEDAKRAFNIATIGIQVFKELDRIKRESVC